MNRRKFLGRFASVAISGLLVVACSPAGTAPRVTTPVGPTPTPLPPTATIEPTTSPLAPPTLAPATTTGAAGGIDVIWAIDGAPDPLSFASRLAMDDRDVLYVLDNGHNRVRTFDRDGKALGMWGSTGADDGQFIVYCPGRDCPPACDGRNEHCLHLPGTVGVDHQGNVYVADYTGRIQKFDPSGKLLAKWGGKGQGDGQFDLPIGIAIDPQGNVYVTDNQLNRVQKFDPSGRFLAKWGDPTSGDGQFAGAVAIALDDQGSVYVADVVRRKIQVFDGQGHFLREFAPAEQPATEGLRVDRAGNVWVLENSFSRLRKFDRDGRELGRWGSLGGGPGQLSYPRDVVVDRAGDVYVVDLPKGAMANSSRIQKWRLR